MHTKKTTVEVPDMKCEGCVNRITNVLERLEGVRSADVSLDDKTAEVEIVDDAVPSRQLAELTAAVEKAGYTVEA